jgi:hypothetical protein
MSGARDHDGAIPADVVPRLTKVAARVAAGHADPQPTSAVAVATTRNKALEVIASYGPETIPGEPGAVPVYAVVMTGRFESYRGKPRPPSRDRRPPLVGSYLTVVVEAATLEVRDVGIGDRGPVEPLSRLGPVTRLSW